MHPRYDRPLGPVPIITQEEAERQAEQFLEAAEKAGAISPRPVGYVVLARRTPESDWRVWSIRLAESHQEVLEDLSLAQRRYGADGTRAAVLYALDGEE